MRLLLDANVLIPLLVPEHEHHLAAQAAVTAEPTIAGCPITEGALVRYIFRTRPDAPSAAETVLFRLRQWEGYEFWHASLSYGDIDLTRIQGHKQVTDAYLVALAAHHGGRLATFDEALAALHPDVALISP